MQAQVIFLTLFLGLASGVRMLDFHVEGAIHSIRVLSDQHEVARIEGPPWRAAVDIGALAPHELVAIGLDAAGNEVARAKQFVNIPKPAAEFQIGLQRNEKGALSAGLHWRHLLNLRPRSAVITVDGAEVGVDDHFRAALPELAVEMPHVISAEMTFEDGFVSRRELVVQGVSADSVDAELTPLLVSRQGEGAAGEGGSCLTLRGRAVRVVAVEKPPARVIIVHEPFPYDETRMLDPTHHIDEAGALHHASSLAPDTSQEIVWPIAETHEDRDRSSQLFLHSSDTSAKAAGMAWALTRSLDGSAHPETPRRFADAVATAALDAKSSAVRAAVVLVLGNHNDESVYDPPAVRTFLRELGVPLFVWSVSPVPSKVAAAWGGVESVATMPRLEQATKKVRTALEEQRVAWLALDPISALRVEAKDGCGFVPVRQAAQRSGQ